MSVSMHSYINEITKNANEFKDDQHSLKTDEVSTLSTIESYVRSEKQLSDYERLKVDR